MKLIEINSSFSKAENSDLVLYRGSREHTELSFTQKIRTDRIPLDSTQRDTRIFNLCMQYLGFPHRKNNTLSTTLKLNQAREYGPNIYRIFPSDDAQYVYSSKSNDLLDFVEALTMQVAFQLGGLGMGGYAALSRATDKDIITALDKIGQFDIFCTSDISETSKAAGEVLVYGSSYQAKLLTFV